MANPEDFSRQPIDNPPASPIYIQYKGIWNMQDLYESIAEFFKRKKFKFYEIQQRLRRPGPFGAEILYQFRATREVEEFYEWTVNITIETFDVHDVEVVAKDGTKKKMTKGRIWIQLYGKVEMDPEHVWDKSAFLAHLKGFYNKYVLRKRIEGVWWDELQYKIVLRLRALITERLKMSSEVNETRHHSGVH